MYLTNVKRKILIASFLKPVNDIRAYEKMAVSIAKNNRYKVYCTGYPVNSEFNNDKIQLISLKPFKRGMISRVISRWKVFKLYIKLKPELIIVNSPDLLIITVLYKILFGGQICYDIRENYFRNLWYQNNYPIIIKHFLAIAVRTREIITSSLFDHFFLAEKVYVSQLSFIGSNYTLLENKSNQPITINDRQRIKKDPVFLISGTLAEEYGLFKAVDFFKLISSVFPKSRLKIIGHCPNAKTYSKLKSIVHNHAIIEVAASKDPVPHDTIIDAILTADFGLLPYLPNKSTSGKWPTKLYEYMAYHLPFIIQTNPLWNTFIEQTNSGLLFDFTNFDRSSCKLITDQLNNHPFYSNMLPPEIYWNDEEHRLLNVIEHLL